MHTHAWRIAAISSIVLLTAHAQQEPADMHDPRTREAAALMAGFADRTGLTTTLPQKRYLWTDAFAVCNFLGLAHLTGEERYRHLALELVDRVHHTLGRHRDDAKRSGWLSRAGEREGESHPTRGGLRIGKALPERAPDEAFDERLEWDRDGQYFHYLTRWMHALDQVARATGQPRYNLWARELARTAADAFTYHRRGGSGTLGMYWKMSIDLTRPLVASMGQHDPLDGYITDMQLAATAALLPEADAGPELEDDARRFRAMVDEDALASPDPLGIGGLLVDAFRLQQLTRQGASVEDGLLESLLTASLAGLEYYVRSGELQAGAEYRLAFRELGLTIGLHAVERLRQTLESGEEHTPRPDGVGGLLRALTRYSRVGREIESFWRQPAHQGTRAWLEHRDINDVMLATSLAPDGYLVLERPPLP
jgi:hypothetical protein